MKYSMQVIVEAEQFLPEENKVPKGVTSDGRFSPRQDPRSGWILPTPEGTEYLKDGDYVVTQPNGDQYRVGADVFEEIYTPMEG